MWLFITTLKRKYNRIFALILVPACLCFANSVTYGTGLRQTKLTDHDRAAIIGFVARNLFKPGSNYEGKHYILADGIRPEWIPKIAGYDVALVTREELQTTNARVFYYVVNLRTLRKSVHVTVTAYDSETKTLPHVVLHYSYRRVGNKWLGKYLWGYGD